MKPSAALRELSERAVAERGLLLRGIPIEGSLNVDVDGFVTRYWTHLVADCPQCGESVRGSLDAIIEHIKDHAETTAMKRLLKRRSRR